MTDQQYRWYLLDPERNEGLGTFLKFRSRAERNAFGEYKNATRNKPNRIKCVAVAEAAALEAIREHGVPVNRAGWV